MDTIENPVIGERITYLITAKQSNGEKTLLEIQLGPKGGNPLHYHRFTESFKVLEGELTVQISKGKKKLKMGETASVPSNAVHRFYNPSAKPVVFIYELNPACEDFENVLRIGCGLANDGKAGSNGMPKNLWHMAILMNMAEGSFVGMFSVLERFFRLLARTAKAKKMEKELLDKYCTKGKLGAAT